MHELMDGRTNEQMNEETKEEMINDQNNQCMNISSSGAHHSRGWSQD